MFFCIRFINFKRLHFWMSLKTACLTGLVVAAALGTHHLLAKQASISESSIRYSDVNSDGITDFIVRPGKGDYSFVLLGRTDDTYLRTEVIINDGIPFYKTRDGVYDSWGQFLPGQFLPPPGRTP